MSQTKVQLIDVNGLEVILDADADTSVTADTDDQIDFKIGGTDQIKLTDGVLAPTTTNDVDLGSTSLRFKDVAISNDIAHLDNAGTARTLYDRSANMLGNTGTNLTAASLYVGGTGSSNQLEDYEEGTWTVDLQDGSGNDVTLNSSQNTGSYVKVGNIVHVNGYIVATSLGSASGDLQINGLPFSIPGSSHFYSTLSVGYAAGLAIGSGTSVQGFAVINTNHVQLTNFDATTGTSHLQASEFSSDGAMIFQLSYAIA